VSHPSLWRVVVRAHAVVGMLLSPFLAFGSFFVARSVLELLFALGQALMVLPFWRIFLFRRWAGRIVCLVGWAVLLFVLAHWKEFDVPSAKAVAVAMAVLPTLALTLGSRIWRAGF